MPVSFPVDDEFMADTAYSGVPRRDDRFDGRLRSDSAYSGAPKAPENAFVKGRHPLRPFKKNADPNDPRYPICDPNDSSRPNPIDPNPPHDDLPWNPNERFYPLIGEVDGSGLTSDTGATDHDFRSSTDYSGPFRGPNGPFRGPFSGPNRKK